MRILESQVSLSGRSSRTTSSIIQEKLTAWANGKRLEYTREAKSNSASVTVSGDKIDLSDTAKDLARDLDVDKLLAEATDALREMAANITMTKNKDEEEEGLTLDAIFSLKILLIEALTGRKVMILNPAKGREQAEARAQAEAKRLAPEEGQPVRQGWGVDYQRHEEIKETEKASFSTDGVVKTADGKEIAFRARVEMSRERVTVSDLSLRAGDALTDPLVINYGGTAAQLTGKKYDFDLNADGAAEKVSFVKSGSGFLVLDRNGDGLATNGTELFAPTTGDGFKELAAYDQDANGWIDENDSVFQDLRIWSKTAAGQDQYDTMLDKNVGAIYLGKAATQFGLYSEQNDKEGQVRSTGVYLTEDGQAQTIQQVDLKT